MNPSLSIVICTYNRASSLAELLTTLFHQAVDTGRYEVIVVDNGSTDHTRAIVEELLPVHPNLRYYVETTVGLSRARNLGWQEASADYIAYIDDDCMVPPHWAAVALEISQTVKPVMFGGPYYAFYRTPKPHWFRDEYGSHEHAQREGELQFNEYLSGGNIVISRSILQALGGFSPDLGMTGDKVAYGEETDVQIRARRSLPGMTIYYSPRLYVYHLVASRKMTWSWNIRQRFADGRYSHRVFTETSAHRFTKIELIEHLARAVARLSLDVVISFVRRNKTK